MIKKVRLIAIFTDFPGDFLSDYCNQTHDAGAGKHGATGGFTPRGGGNTARLGDSLREPGETRRVWRIRSARRRKYGATGGFPPRGGGNTARLAVFPRGTGINAPTGRVRCAVRLPTL